MEQKSLEEKIKRINELYHKSQSEGLNEEEKIEQDKLRKDYINNIRANMRGQLNTINIQEEDGSITNLGEKYGDTNKHSGFIEKRIFSVSDSIRI